MQETPTDLDLTVNGVRHTGRQVPGDMSLVHFLHEDLGLTGTRVGCSIGECRACTVAVRPRPGAAPVTRQACMTAMRHVAGWEVTTVEGLAAADGALHPVQRAILDRDAFQCGYCAAGFAVAGSVAVEQAAGVGDAGGAVDGLVETVLGPHLCRCTGYSRYLDAVRSVAEAAAHAAPARAGLRTAAAATAGAGPTAEAAAARTALSPAERDALGYTPLFDDPRLELIRLLRDGAEIEHSLLVQYLYAAFSVKQPRYARLAGWPSHRYGGRPLHLMGVAIEEMTHLDVVNGLLVALGAAPHLGRQQFPYEKDVYPFDFALEPLSLHSLAKYVYVEAPPGAVDPDLPHPPEDLAFIERLYAVLGGGARPRPHQVGSLYRKVARVLELLEAREPGLLDYPAWHARLDIVREEGESEHFELFRALFDGTHPTLADAHDVWNPDSPDHPVLPLRLGSGLPPTGEAVPDGTVPALRHLANLHYWAVCMLLDQSYRRGGLFHSAARRHMTGPLRSLGSALARLGEGVPFDVFVAGYAPGRDDAGNLELTRVMLRQVAVAQQRHARHLPPDYAHTCVAETLWECGLADGGGGGGGG
ncbi:ferritin-like domain-containing protein [Streptomyces sp. NPDC059564]|uniref:ferritin-like domain-containing protein n=1 Tax=Streptomyces sp. NPDC059564 TaxID=3346865 RepID=UPI00368E51B5